jgi:ParB family transcriptional regulator, chromosome partitioning protein
MGEGTGMKGRDALREMLAEGKPKEQEATIAAPRPAGAVKSMSLGLQRLSDEAAAARSLRATLAAAEQVVEIAAEDVEVSFMTDRIPIESDSGFESLKEKIRLHGQQVPILVRPHPDDPKRYQAAYGHRRLRAARDLERPIKAIVRRLTDAELVVAQGQENSERRDLSFIERALFASLLEKREFDRDTITAALGVDKPELSRLLGVVAAIDTRMILAIGPAPKVGRPRWLALAEKMNGAKATKVAEHVIASEGFSQRDSNARFNSVLSALLERAPSPKEKRGPVNIGKPIAWIERTRKGLRLVSEESSFASFLELRLPDLLREFEERAGGPQIANPKEAG